MPQQSLADTIRQIRFRVRSHGSYLSKVDETRTRYTLIDPVLYALGWDVSDPSQVMVEVDISVSTAVKKVDYALYKSGITKRPWILVEAKRLDDRQIERFIQTQSLRRIELVDSWDALATLSTQRNTRWSEFNSENADDPSVDHETEWSQLSRPSRVQQLLDYVHEFGMVAGYGVLTDGDEWSIYRLNGDQKFQRGPTEVVRILGVDDVDKCVQALNTLRRPD